MSDSECLYAETEYQESQYARSDEDSEAEIEGIAGEPDGELKSSEGPPGSPPGLPQAGSSKAELSNPSNPPQSGPGQGGRAKVPESALKILRERFPDWKNSDKEERKKHWRAITEAVRALPDHKTMSKQEWQASLRQGRAGREKKMKLGHQWTARSVVREEHKECLKEIILEKYGAAPGSVEMLGLYQTELNELIDELSEETWLEASRTAEEWNTQGPAPDVQARFATRKAQEFVKKFAVEMWKKGGIRMVILSDSRTRRGNLCPSVSGETQACRTSSHLFAVHDFNDEIADGPSFENAEEVQGSFDRYLSKCFDPPKDGDQGAEEDGDREKKQVGKPKKSQGRRRDDVVEKVLLPDGTVWIPEVQNLSRADLQDLVRGFLTAHYSPHPRRPQMMIEEAPPTHSRSSRSRFQKAKEQKLWDRDTTDDGSEDAGEEVDELEENSKASDKFGRPNLREGRAMDAGWICTLMREKGTEEGSRHLLLSAETSGLSLTMSMMPEPSMARRGNVAKEKDKANWEKDERAEQAHYAGIKYGPPRNIPKEKKVRGTGREPTPPPDRHDLRAGMARPRKVPKEKGQMGEGSRQGREPTPPPNHQDLRAELDNVDKARIKYGPPRKPTEEGSSRERPTWKTESRKRSRALSLINGTKGLTKNMLRSGRVKADLDRAEDGPLQKVQKEEGPEAERSKQGGSRRLHVVEDVGLRLMRRYPNQGQRSSGAGSRRAREASLDEGDCMEQSKDNRIKYSQLKKAKDHRQGLSPIMWKMPVSIWPTEEGVAGERARGRSGSRPGKGTEPSACKMGWQQAEINYPKMAASSLECEEDYKGERQEGEKREKGTDKEGSRRRGLIKLMPGMSVAMPTMKGVDRKRGRHLGLVTGKQEARVEKRTPNRHCLSRKEKAKRRDEPTEIPDDYARKDTTQVFDELPLFYADAGSASNKTIAKPVYQDDKVADFGQTASQVGNEEAEPC
ncbi:hypothetical protein EV363DRAFT_1296014 [Boletus edulis]|nr:hypothetical protein EV363DRAFT_1296014 [Boletus edulis]